MITTANLRDEILVITMIRITEDAQTISFARSVFQLLRTNKTTVKIGLDNLSSALRGSGSEN